VEATSAAPVRLTPVQRRVWLLSAGGVALDGFDLFVMAVALTLLEQQFDPGPPSTAPESPAWVKQKAGEESGEVEVRKEPSYVELFRGRNLARTGLCAGSWFTMDFLMYGVGLFTPMLLAGMGFGQSAVDFIAKDVAVTEGTVVLDLMFVVGFVVAIVLVERVGRMPLQKAGFLGMGVALVLLGAAGLVSDPVWMVALGFGLFNLMVNAGPNSTTFLVPTEVYSTRLRATGHGFAAAAGKAGAAVGAFLLPSMQDGLGVPITMFILAGISIGGFALTQVLGVETRGKDIVEMVPTEDALFNEIERVEVETPVD